MRDQQEEGGEDDNVGGGGGDGAGVANDSIAGSSSTVRNIYSVGDLKILSYY